MFCQDIYGQHSYFNYFMHVTIFLCEPLRWSLSMPNRTLAYLCLTTKIELWTSMKMIAPHCYATEKCCCANHCTISGSLTPPQNRTQVHTPSTLMIVIVLRTVIAHRSPTNFSNSGSYPRKYGTYNYIHIQHTLWQLCQFLGSRTTLYTALHRKFWSFLVLKLIGMYLCKDNGEDTQNKRTFF